MKKPAGSVKNDFVLPIVVLTAICLVITALLALTNSATAPVIAEASAERAEAARAEIIPEAEGFELLEIEGLPASVKEVYSTVNDVGYIFMLSTMGYGGEMDLILGMSNDGTIIDVKTLKHSETKGMGSKTAEEPFRSQFRGKDKNLEGVDAITGATISSTAYIGAVEDAFKAFDMINGAETADGAAAENAEAVDTKAEDATTEDAETADGAAADEATDDAKADAKTSVVAERRAL